jgi:hypothetical protein
MPGSFGLIVIGTGLAAVAMRLGMTADELKKSI